jgi:hypothetical protein
MAGYTAMTNIQELIPEITERVDYIFQNASIGRGLVTYRDVSSVPGSVVEFPYFTEVSASTSVAETATPASHQMDISMASLTIAKRSVYVGLGDVAAKAMTGNAADIAQAMGMAKAKAIDASIFNVISTTNYATSAGSTDQQMSITYVLNAINILEENEAELPFNVVVHPHQYNYIRAALTPIANDDAVSVDIANEMTRMGFVSRAFGLNWYVTNRVSSRTVDATSNCWSGLVFSPRGIGYAYSDLYTAGVEVIRSDEALSKLLLNWADSAGVIYASGVCTLYSTSS